MQPVILLNSCGIAYRYNRLFVCNYCKIIVEAITMTFMGFSNVYDQGVGTPNLIFGKVLVQWENEAHIHSAGAYG